jgi:BMFP domain-containing protein YqiC
MESRNRLFDDVAKVAGGAAGTLSGIKGEIESRMRQRLDDLVARLDLVTREEFDAVSAVAAKAREEQEALAKRLAELEAELARMNTDRQA